MGFFSRTTSTDPIVTKIKEMEPVLRERGADTLYVFGLASRGDARPGSDVDLLVGDDNLTLPQLVAITELVGNGLDISVHITTPASLDATTRADIKARATRVF